MTQRFGSFTAVDHVSFRIERGEIFGFLGANGCGKSTTMKMLCGLLPPSEGQAWLFGEPVDANDLAIRSKVGYMSQAFSLYSELSVRQNLTLHARLFHVPEGDIPERVEQTAARFGLDEIMDLLPDSLPLGQRQRLQLAVALIHGPDLLILDEPTSGVDPVARDGFWEHLVELSRHDKVTIFVSTHFINEAERCDRISLMSAGQGAGYRHAGRRGQRRPPPHWKKPSSATWKMRRRKTKPPSRRRRQRKPRWSRRAAAESASAPSRIKSRFSLQRMLSCSYREALELSRDPIRLTMAGLGSVILMIIMGYGITLDVEHLKYAVLDRDQTTVSHDYTINIAGASRYFNERPPVADYQELDRRMRSGELSMVVEIPSGFGRDVERKLNGALATVSTGAQSGVGGDTGRDKQPATIGVWIDGAMPQRGETIRGYLQGTHLQWLQQAAQHRFGVRLSSAWAAPAD